MSAYAERMERTATEERRARRFAGLIEDHAAALTGRNSMANDDRANRLPLGMLRRQNRSQRFRHAFHWVGITAVAFAALIGAGAVFTFLVTGAMHVLVWIAG